MSDIINYPVWIMFRTDSGTGGASTNEQQENKRAPNGFERFGSGKALPLQL
jgi:hypothetical protein